MSCEHPETGTAGEESIKWGLKEVDIPTINNITTIYDSGSETGSMPRLFDPNNDWNLSVLGEVNQYVATDIDGKNKTEKILVYATAQSDWQTASTITNGEMDGYAPAACCCARYHTLGTQPGNWYLGAGGEICIATSKRNVIEQKLNQINNIYPTYCIGSFANNRYLTSTEYGANSIYSVDQTGIYKPDKDSGNPAFAIIQY
jgi:hypothetical protein